MRAFSLALFVFGACGGDVYVYQNTPDVDGGSSQGSDAGVVVSNVSHDSGKIQPVPTPTPTPMVDAGSTKPCFLNGSFDEVGQVWVSTVPSPKRYEKTVENVVWKYQPCENASVVVSEPYEFSNSDAGVFSCSLITTRTISKVSENGYSFSVTRERDCVNGVGLLYTTKGVAYKL